MKGFVCLLTLCLLWGCASQVELSGRSAPGPISLRPFEEHPGEAPSLPASIALVDKRFEEPSGNRALDAEEEGALVLELRNDGLGPGKVVVRLTPLSQYCREVLGIPEERILLRTDSDATKAEFDYVFEPKGTASQGWLKKRLRDPKEVARVDLIVYLAGHGFPDMTTGNPYLIPYDVRPEQATNGVALEELYRTLGEFGTRSVTVFVESCFSGVSGYDRGGEKKVLAMNMNPVGIRLLRPAVEANTVVFTATSGDSPSSNRDDLKHGIFTYFALKGMGGAADGNGDGGITVEELFRYVSREVPRKALEPPLDREQVPEILPSAERLGERGKRVLVRY